MNKVKLSTTCAKEEIQDFNFLAHEELQRFLSELDLNSTNHNIIFTVLEFQYWHINIMHLENTKCLTHDIINMIFFALDAIKCKFISSDKVIIASVYTNAFQNKINLLFFDLVKYSSNIKQNILLNFKAGSCVWSKDSKLDLSHAFIALAKSKELPSSHHIFYHQSNADKKYDDINLIKDQNQMIRYFIEARDDNRLKLAFQPIVSSANGSVDSYEALLRIVTLEGEIISAGPFIKVAESLGVIDVIDEAVLEVVSHELMCNHDVKISMNISGNTVYNQNWIAKAKKLLQDYNIASRLIVEITESAKCYHLEQMIDFSDNLRWLGCQISVDDFGAGYTSFTQLKMLQIDYIKIDGVFVRNLLTSTDSKLFIKMFIDFAKAYDIKTVAEFVETGEIAKCLINLGVDYLQGYYFSKALDYRPWTSAKNGLFGN